MFKENKRLSAADTLIGQGTRAEGTLICQASLRIEGEFRGDIECKADVVVGESGVARSNISARDITISGKVFGDVVTTGRLTIMSSGQLFGSASAASLMVQDGGILSGSCRMAQPAAAEQANASSLEAKAEGHLTSKAQTAGAAAAVQSRSDSSNSTRSGGDSQASTPSAVSALAAHSAVQSDGMAPSGRSVHSQLSSHAESNLNSGSAQPPLRAGHTAESPTSREFRDSSAKERRQAG